jgi:hypothetical protein
MQSSWKRVSSVVLIAVIAFGVIAPGLQAGLITAGRFKLPFDAQLGKIALPAGDYMFTIDGLSLNGKIIIYRENRPVGILFPQMFSDRENKSKNPVWVCLRHDGKVAIRALRLPNVGTFYFSLPKELSVLTAQQPQLIETVSVEVTGS